MKTTLETLKSILRLPAIVLHLDPSHTEGERMYTSFSRRHPRMPLVKFKSIGVALLSLHEFQQPEEYLKTVSGKNSAAYFSRKAERAGYRLQEFNAAQHQQEIIRIHLSADTRQGKELPDNYRNEIDYPQNAYNRYMGVFKGEDLVGYLWLIVSGDVAVINRIMGHQDHLKEGIMYFLVTETISRLIRNKENSIHLMYDTYFGASDGLKMFKRRLGFKPYRVTWKTLKK